ncbi:MAG TPA: VanZ family protein [Gammaproteobacteria bacterium]|nr:VanZ family protein [Gammaproteobacteria bacterium]
MPIKLRIFIPLAYMLGIFALSSIPDTGRIESQIDKIFHWVSPELQNLLHIPLFGGLAGCWYWALKPWINGFENRIVTAFIITTIYSFFDEYHQLSVPGRFGSFTDLGLDAVGSILVLTAIIIHKRT